MVRADSLVLSLDPASLMGEKMLWEDFAFDVF